MEMERRDVKTREELVIPRPYPYSYSVRYSTVLYSTVMMTPLMPLMPLMLCCRPCRTYVMLWSIWRGYG